MSAVHVDPEHHFLLQRHWGEPSVRFELPASKAPDGVKVSLSGNFMRAPIPATLQGSVWVVDLPMTEGEYVWLWQIGNSGEAAAAADPSLMGTRTVRPRQRITNAYPGR